jgi:hypothetical protein
LAYEEVDPAKSTFFHGSRVKEEGEGMKSMHAAVIERDVADVGERQRIQFVRTPGLTVIAQRAIEAQPTVKDIYAGLAADLISTPPFRARDFKHYGVPGDTLPL